MIRRKTWRYRKEFKIKDVNYLMKEKTIETKPREGNYIGRGERRHPWWQKGHELALGGRGVSEWVDSRRVEQRASDLWRMFAKAILKERGLTTERGLKFQWPLLRFFNGFCAHPHSVWSPLFLDIFLFEQQQAFIPPMWGQSNFLILFISELPRVSGGFFSSHWQIPIQNFFV